MRVLCTHSRKIRCQIKELSLIYRLIRGRRPSSNESQREFILLCTCLSKFTVGVSYDALDTTGRDFYEGSGVLVIMNGIWISVWRLVDVLFWSFNRYGAVHIILKLKNCFCFTNANTAEYRRCFKKYFRYHAVNLPIFFCFKNLTRKTFLFFFLCLSFVPQK